MAALIGRESVVRYSGHKSSGEACAVRNMAQSESKSELLSTARQNQRGARARRRGDVTTRVVVDWSSTVETEAGRCLAPVTLELEARSPPNAGGVWRQHQPGARCGELAGASWLDVIAGARCSEIVLTARLADDAADRHLVLELAELLTQRLSATKPHIRVRFLPPPTGLGSAA